MSLITLQCAPSSTQHLAPPPPPRRPRWPPGRLGADHARGEGHPGHAHGFELGRRFLDGGPGISDAAITGSAEPGRDQEGGDAGGADRFLAADGGQDDAVGRGRDAEHAHPVGPGEPRHRRACGAAPRPAARWCCRPLRCARWPRWPRWLRAAPDGGRVRRHHQRHHHGRGRARRPPRRRVGQDRRIPDGSPRPPWSIRAVRTSSAGLSTRSTVAMSAVGPVRHPRHVRHREHQRRRALGQAQRHRTPVTAARRDQPGLRLGEPSGAADPPPAAWPASSVSGRPGRRHRVRLPANLLARE